MSGKWLFDTNLLIYALDAASPFHAKTSLIFKLIEQEQIVPVVAQQNITEAVSVLIKFSRLKPIETYELVANLIKSYSFSIISPLPNTWKGFGQILKKGGRKVDIFDAYLAATMTDNKIHKILTVNNKDFASFDEIEVLNPLD